MEGRGCEGDVVRGLACDEREKIACHPVSVLESALLLRTVHSVWIWVRQLDSTTEKNPLRILWCAFAMSSLNSTMLPASMYEMRDFKIKYLFIHSFFTPMSSTR